MIDLTQVRADHSMVAQHSEDAAWGSLGRNFGVSFKQGYRAGWWDAVQWLLSAQDEPGLMWGPRAVTVHVDLLLRGVHRPVRDVDLAIQSARQALHDDEYVWLDANSDAAWEVLEPHVYRFLDLTDTEIKAVA